MQKCIADIAVPARACIVMGITVKYFEITALWFSCKKGMYSKIYLP
ncbi:hypothetical protein ACFFLS_12400 [Flavobacterium procerum]|uniref:Uncharacterized protein n=1 Tax=Flavobacterium procerum TaxID=1455569 RepID=A0ABV6BQW7_9FLAO